MRGVKPAGGNSTNDRCSRRVTASAVGVTLPTVPLNRFPPKPPPPPPPPVAPMAAGPCAGPRPPRCATASFTNVSSMSTSVFFGKPLVLGRKKVLRERSTR